MANYLRVDGLLSNAAITGPIVKWPGGAGVLYVRGTFGGATVALHTDLALGAGTFGPVAGVSLTAPGAINFNLPPCDIRCDVTGGAPSGLFAHAVRINP